MFTRDHLKALREEYRRTHPPGPPIPRVRIWEVRYRELYDDTHMYKDFTRPISLLFPAPSSIDFALSVVRERYKESDTPIDIDSVRHVSKAEYIRWLAGKVNLTDESGRQLTPKRYADEAVRRVEGWSGENRPDSIRSKDILRLVPPPTKTTGSCP